MTAYSVMNAPAPAVPESRAEEVMSDPLRRCIVTRDILPKDALIRFVIGPSGEIVPDVQGKLPGRGLWVKAERGALASAVAKGRFAKAARQPVDVSPDLVDRTAALLRQRCLDLIGLSRRAGQAVCGYERVRKALRDEGVGVLIAAADGAEDGRRRLKAMASDVPTLALFTTAELSAAFGRENVVHAALAAGRLAERLIAESARLAGVLTDTR
jgi:uncharacterized protein